MHVVGQYHYRMGGIVMRLRGACCRQSFCCVDLALPGQAAQALTLDLPRPGDGNSHAVRPAGQLQAAARALVLAVPFPHG